MDPLIASGQPAPLLTLPDLAGGLHALAEQRGQVDAAASKNHPCMIGLPQKCLLG